MHHVNVWCPQRSEEHHISWSRSCVDTGSRTKVLCKAASVLKHWAYIELSLQSLILWFKIMYGVVLFKKYTLHAEHIVNLYLFLQTCITMPNLTNLLFIFFFVCMGVLPACACAPCACCTHRDQKRAPDSVEMCMTLWVLGTKPRSSGKSASALTTESYPQTLVF